MTKELFCELLGEIQDEFVVEAWGDITLSEGTDSKTNRRQNSRKNKQTDRGTGRGLNSEVSKGASSDVSRKTNTSVWNVVFKSRAGVRVAVVAGMAAIIVVCLIMGGIRQYHSSDLPVLTISALQSEGMGFEALLYQSTEELVWSNQNPFVQSQMADVVMPVYRNENFVSRIPVGLDTDVMVERLEKAAAALGISVVDWKPMSQSAKVYRVYTETEAVRIESDADGTVTIWFKDRLVLPESYHFMHSGITDEEVQEVMAYLVEQYEELLGFVQPLIAIEGDRDIYNNYGWSCKVYDGVGNDTDRLLSYCFHYAEFAPDDEGNLMLIRLHDKLAASEKIGDYPVITEEEAWQKLLAGEYLTTVPYPLPGKDAVVMAELVYRNSNMEENFLPYYRFYVNLPEDFLEWENLSDGLKLYGVYYVPAVVDEYLSKEYLSKINERGGMQFQ
ncbi:MAG: hypothetical protein IJ794_03815 [Lachnospiraceae bacterium]|nr:hypothetical protein [Lachnospiraceae bacterium]